MQAGKGGYGLTIVVVVFLHAFIIKTKKNVYGFILLMLVSSFFYARVGRVCEVFVFNWSFAPPHLIP